MTISQFKEPVVRGEKGTRPTQGSHFEKFVKLFVIIVGVTTETLVGCKTFIKSLSLCQVSDQPSVDCIAYGFYVLLWSVDHNFVIIFGEKWTNDRRNMAS